MKRSTTIVMAVFAALALSSCAPAIAAQEKPDAEFKYVHDWAEPKVPSGATRILEERQGAAAQAAEEAEAAVEEAYYEEYYAPAYYSAWEFDGDGFMQEGVRSGVDSDTETWYSSNVAYLRGTENFHTDDEGYWRDSDGYYVVSSDDYGKGEVVNTSKGEAKVYDDGTSSGNIDMYVNW